MPVGRGRYQWLGRNRKATAVWVPPSWPAPPAPPREYRFVTAVGRLRLTGRPTTRTYGPPALSAARGTFVLTGAVARLLRDAVLLAASSPRGAIVDEDYAPILDENGQSVMPDA